MKLVYIKTGNEVKVGDIVETGKGEEVVVEYFAEPHKPSSSGKVSVKPNRKQGEDEVIFSREFFVSIIDAEWIEREDRGE